METTTLPLLIEPSQLNANLSRPDLLIVDLCRTEQFHSAHIPGAVHLPFPLLMSGDSPAAGTLPNIKLMSKVLGSIGLTPQCHVVAYDDEGGGWAGRLLWTLDMIGHGNWSYLNGGLHAWAGERLALEKAVRAVTASFPDIEYLPGPMLEMDAILAKLGATDFAIWDARSAEEYSGQRMGARRNGHIPGAANYEWTRAMDRHNGLRIRPLEQIRAELAELGITADKQIVTHCQSHHRSAFTYLLGRILGFNRIHAYPGSWSEWGNHPHTPVEGPTLT